MLCKYKDIFGKVGKGIHSYKIFNISIIDVLLTILVAFIISLFTKYNFIIILISLCILGIIFHHIFCVRTTIDKLLFS
jgi:hypothetical protein